MTTLDLVIRGRRVVVPASLNSNYQGDISQFEIIPAAIHVRAGKIVGVTSYNDIAKDCAIVEAGDHSIVMPGLVDTHVHINEPGRTDWEGFATATRAAAAGGVTTLVDMPLNSIPPTTTLDGFRQKLAAAENKCFVDIGFWGGVVPGNTNELSSLFDLGVVGFKCFLIHSGVDEFPNVTETDLRAAMSELSRLGAVLIVHAELPGPIDQACCAQEGSESAERKYETFLRSRPRAAEDEAVALMIRLSREFGTRVHVVHHSSADALPMLREARAAGLSITAETCPHYLHFAAEEIRDGATEFKCCPPIRERENREQLWQAVAEGTIDMIVSDHSPCPPELKLRDSGDFLKAWGGISSLQLRLPIVWTEASKRGHRVEDLARWLCAAPAKLVDFEARKGSIAPGCDADIVIWNPEREFSVTPEVIHHRHKLTPYAGEVLRGVVEKTFLRGKLIYDDGEFVGRPAGEMLLRE